MLQNIHSYMAYIKVFVNYLLINFCFQEKKLNLRFKLLMFKL
jgi:hypothetical protein